MRIKKTSVNLVEGDLTPMIDMTFQLIAFFMVLINFTEADQDERIKLPTSVLAKPADGPIESPITIHVAADGAPILAGNMVSLEELRRGLKREKELLGLRNKTPGDANIIIRGDGDAPTGKVQEIIQICQEERFEKFKLRRKNEWNKTATKRFRTDNADNAMRVRNTTSNEKIELQMTPMIDIVFQLLIFFIMTFKIVALEGDFNIKMPAAAPSEGTPDEDQLPPITLKLTANQDGDLSGILVNDQRFRSFGELHQYIIDLVGEDAGPDAGLEGAEVEIDCDENLKYINVVEAMTAVTGDVTEDGTIIKLIEKIKFTPLLRPHSKDTSTGARGERGTLQGRALPSAMGTDRRQARGGQRPAIERSLGTCSVS